jgi:hypothetical protein
LIPGTYAPQLTRLNPLDRRDDCWNESEEIFQAVGPCSDKYNPKCLISERLLVTKIPVHCDEHVEFACRPAKKFAVLDSTPTSLLDGFYCMRTEVFAKPDGKVLIK